MNTTYIMLTSSINKYIDTVVTTKYMLFGPFYFGRLETERRFPGW